VQGDLRVDCRRLGDIDAVDDQVCSTHEIGDVFAGDAVRVDFEPREWIDVRHLRGKRAGLVLAHVLDAHVLAVGDDAHTKGPGAPGCGSGAEAKADQAQGAAGEAQVVLAELAGARIVAGNEAVLHARHVPQQHQQHGHAVY